MPPSDGPENGYRLLCNELMRLMLAQQLFIFVTAAAVEMPDGESAPVAGTNNEAERELRGPAIAGAFACFTACLSNRTLAAAIHIVGLPIPPLECPAAC